VHLFLLLAEANRLQRTLTNLASLSDLGQLELEGHVVDPEVRRVWRSEQKTLVVGRNLGCLGLEISALICNDNSLLLGLLLLGGLVVRIGLRVRMVALGIFVGVVL